MEIKYVRIISDSSSSLTFEMLIGTEVMILAILECFTLYVLVKLCHLLIRRLANVVV